MWCHIYLCLRLHIPIPLFPYFNWGHRPLTFTPYFRWGSRSRLGYFKSQGSLSRKTGPIWQVHRLLFLRLLLKLIVAWASDRTTTEGGKTKCCMVPTVIIRIMIYGSYLVGLCPWLQRILTGTWGSARASTHILKIIFYTQNSHLEIAIEYKSKWISLELTTTANHRL